MNTDEKLDIIDKDLRKKNKALEDMKYSRFNGAAVLKIN